MSKNECIPHSSHKDSNDKNKKKYHHSRNSGCNINNTINLCSDDNKTCETKKVKKCNCCIDTTTLKEMLLLFKQNNTSVLIFTETLTGKFETPLLPLKFIHAIINNMVYISNTSSNGPIEFIIPLNNISFVLAISTAPVPGISDIINEIITEPTSKKDPCCYLSGMGDTLNSLSDVSFLLPLSSGLYTIVTSGLILGFRWVDQLVTFILLLLFRNVITAANDDIFVMFFNDPNPPATAYLIIPTHKIDVIVLPDNNNTSTLSITNSPAVNKLLSLLDEDTRTKIEKLDFESLSNDIKGKSVDEIFEKISLLLK